MTRLRWFASYLYFRIEAVWHGFADAGHYARYSADLTARPRLEEPAPLQDAEMWQAGWENFRFWAPIWLGVALVAGYFYFFN